MARAKKESTDKQAVMPDFEKLGVFYLGRPYDLAAKKPKDGLLLYDSKDLVTHAVCVGMTGERHRGLFILKSRGMAHSSQIRSFLLTDHGIQLGSLDMAGPTNMREAAYKSN